LPKEKALSGFKSAGLNKREFFFDKTLQFLFIYKSYTVLRLYLEKIYNQFIRLDHIVIKMQRNKNHLNVMPGLRRKLTTKTKAPPIGDAQN
jgi:hypothetical protein